MRDRLEQSRSPSRGRAIFVCSTHGAGADEASDVLAHAGPVVASFEQCCRGIDAAMSYERQLVVKRDEVRAAGCVPNHERAAGCVEECKILVCNPFVFATSCHEVGVHVARAEEGEDVNLERNAATRTTKRGVL